MLALKSSHLKSSIFINFLELNSFQSSAFELKLLRKTESLTCHKKVTRRFLLDTLSWLVAHKLKALHAYLYLQVCKWTICFTFLKPYANATTPQQYVLQEHIVPEHFLWLSASMYIRIVEHVWTYERLELWQRPQRVWKSSCAKHAQAIAWATSSQIQSHMHCWQRLKLPLRCLVLWLTLLVEQHRPHSFWKSCCSLLFILHLRCLH